MQNSKSDEVVIVSFAYDEQHEILEVQFAGGAVARYNRAPKYLFLGLKGARSAEKFWRTIIEPRYKRVPVYRLHWEQQQVN